MGNANPRITSPYYDRYFGPNYNRIVGNNLGDYGQYYVGGSCCPTRPGTPPLPCSPPPPVPLLAPPPSQPQPLPLPLPLPLTRPPKPISIDLKIQPTQPFPQPPQQISPPMPTFCSNDYFREENNNSSTNNNNNHNGPIYLPPIDLESTPCVKFYDNGLKPPPNFNPPLPFPPINSYQPNHLPQVQNQVNFQNQQNLMPYQLPPRLNMTQQYQQQQKQQQPLNMAMKPQSTQQQYIPPPPAPPAPPPSSQPIIHRQQPQIISSTQQIVQAPTQSLNQLPQAQSTSSQTNFFSNTGQNQSPIISSNKFPSSNPNVIQQTNPLQFIQSGQRSKKRYSHYDFLPLMINNQHNKQARSSQLITIDERFGGIYSSEEICGGFISTNTTKRLSSSSKPSRYSYQGHKSLSNFDGSSNSDRVSTYYLPQYETDYKLKSSRRSSYDFSLEDNKFSKSSRHYFI
jgi:hypothetical protein